MQVESYLIEELNATVNDSEATELFNELVTKLELDGQANLHKDSKKPIPFPRMKTGEMRVYRVHCPQTEDVTKYSGDTIPLRVLSLIALAREQKYFGYMEVWHALDKPDPILVGYTGGSRWAAASEGPFLIARWGDELETFSILKEQAKTLLLESWKSKLSSALQGAESSVVEYLAGKDNQWIRLES